MRARILAHRAPLIVAYVLLGCDPEHKTRPVFAPSEERGDDRDPIHTFFGTMNGPSLSL